MTVHLPGDLSEELLTLIMDELNVKAIKLEKNDVLTVELDTVLTKELEDEGTARDLMRDIQGARKKLGLKSSDLVEVELPSWPEAWTEEIKKKVGAKELKVGHVLSVTKI